MSVCIKLHQADICFPHAVVTQLAALRPKASEFFVSIDGYDVTCDTLSTILDAPLSMGLGTLWLVESFAARRRDITAAQSASARRADFKARLKKDLDDHSSWAHKLVRGSSVPEVALW